MRVSLPILVVAILALTACGKKRPAEEPAPKPEKEEEPVKEEPVSEMAAKVARFAPVEIGVADEKIPEKHRPLIAKLVEAARVMDELFLLQVARENPKWRAEIAADPALADTLALFDIMYGPWDRLEDGKPFWGEKERPPGVTFYPEDMTKEEFEKWVADHPGQKEAFTGYFTEIQREGDGLVAVPYSEVHAEELVRAAALLKEAAGLAEDPRLKKYLNSRAAAFASNEYRRSDMDWMDLGDGDIEVVIGPYEVYEDRLFGYKAAFEAFVTLRDPEDSAVLEKIKELLPKMEAYLPIPDEHRNPHRGSESPISVVEVLYTGGDTRAGVQTLAFVLPNDEVVREQKGSKKVLLKNVAHAKFNKILVPIASRLMRADQVDAVTFEAFFNHTLMHEIAHGLGPGRIEIERDGEKVRTTVNEALRDLYSAIEEAKADTVGMYLNYMMVEEGLKPKSFIDNVYAAFLGGFFRSVRFGPSGAHGQANIIQFNYMMEQGAIFRGEDGRYAYDADKMRSAVKSLARDILMIQAKGDYDAAKAFIGKYGTMPEQLKRDLAGLTDIPTDIRPTYPVERQMERW